MTKDKSNKLSNKFAEQLSLKPINSKSIFELLKIAFLALFVFMLTSCKDKINRIKPVTFFTTKIIKETDYNITLKPDYSITEPLVYKSFSISGSQKISSKPTIKDGFMYVLDNNGTLSSLDMNNNFKKKWSTKTTNQKTNLRNSGGTQIIGDKIYVTNGTRDLVVLGKEDGLEITRLKFSNIIKSRPVSNSLGVIFIITIDDNLYAVDSENFKILWNKESIYEIISQSEENKLSIYNDKLLVNYSSGRTSCYDVSSKFSIDESKSWIHNLADETAIVPDFSYLNITSDPVIYNSENDSRNGSLVYLSNGSGFVYAINLNSGAILFKKNFQDVQVLKNYGNGFFVINNAKQFAGLSEDLKVAFVIDSLSKSDNPEKFIDTFASNDSVYVVSEKAKIYQVDLQNQKIAKTINISITPRWVLDDEQNIYIVGETKLLIIAKTEQR